MPSSSGSSGLPPSNKPSRKPAIHKTDVNSTSESVQNQATPKPAPKKDSDSSLKKEAGIFTPEATEGSYVRVAGQIKKPSSTAETAKIIETAIRDAKNKPNFGLNSSTYDGLAKMAKDYSKNSSKYDSLVSSDSPDDEFDGLEAEDDKLKDAIRLAFSG